MFMPYNYLIDEKIRENFEIDFKNSVMIFDEAHNTAPASEEISSFELRSSYLEKCIREFDTVEINLEASCLAVLHLC